MLLDNFFYLQMPYGMLRNADGTWYVVNREHMPLGWNNTDLKENFHFTEAYRNLPIHTRYTLTDAQIVKILAGAGNIQYDDNGNIKRFYFYHSESNPTSGHWKTYAKIMERMASIQSVGLL